MGPDRSAELRDMVAGPRDESLSSWGMPPPQNRQGKGGLVQENKKLKSQVHVLEHEVEALSSAMQSKLAAGPGTRRSNGARRVKRTFRTQVTALADPERESACLSPDERVQRQRGPI